VVADPDPLGRRFDACAVSLARWRLLDPGGLVHLLDPCGLGRLLDPGGLGRRLDPGGLGRRLDPGGLGRLPLLFCLKLT